MNDTVESVIGTLVVAGGIVFLYIRAYIALIRIEKATKETAALMKAADADRVHDRLQALARLELRRE